MRSAITLVALLTLSSPALGQTPDLVVPQSVVTPGAQVTATVVGTPGDYYALLGSAVGAGLTFGGVPLSVGTDYAVVASGQFDGSGRAMVTGVPPFLFTTLDRYYLQVVTSATANFASIVASPGRILRNG